MLKAVPCAWWHDKLGKPKRVSVTLFMYASWHHLLSPRKSNKGGHCSHIGVNVGLRTWSKGESCGSDYRTWFQLCGYQFSQQQYRRRTYLGWEWGHFVKIQKRNHGFRGEIPVGGIASSYSTGQEWEPWGWRPLCFYPYLTFDFKSPSTGIPLFARSSSLWSDYLT